MFKFARHKNKRCTRSVNVIGSAAVFINAFLYLKKKSLFIKIIFFTKIKCKKLKIFIILYKTKCCKGKIDKLMKID